MVVVILFLIKIISSNIGGSGALQGLLRRALWEMHAQCSQATETHNPSDSPGNLENMPCGLAVITLAQREARPQPIWWGEQPSLSLECFISPSEIDFVPQRRHLRHNRAEKRKKKTVLKNAPVTVERQKHNRFKGKVRNQSASRG